MVPVLVMEWLPSESLGANQFMSTVPVVQLVAFTSSNIRYSKLMWEAALHYGTSTGETFTILTEARREMMEYAFLTYQCPFKTMDVDKATYSNALDFVFTGWNNCWRRTNLNQISRYKHTEIPVTVPHWFNWPFRKRYRWQFKMFIWYTSLITFSRFYLFS